MRLKILFISGYLPFTLAGFFLLHNMFQSSLIFDQINLLTLAYFMFCVLVAKRSKLLSKEMLLFLFAVVIALSQIFSQLVLNIDRSRSFYILSWVRFHEIKSNGDTFDLAKVESEEKLSTQSIDIRIKEQLSRGLIKKDSSEITLTTSGRFIVKLSDLFSKIFNLRGWANNNH